MWQTLVLVLRCQQGYIVFYFSVFIFKCFKIGLVTLFVRLTALWVIHSACTLHSRLLHTHVLPPLVIQLFVDVFRISAVRGKWKPSVSKFIVKLSSEGIVLSVFSNIFLCYLINLFTKLMYFLPPNRGFKWSFSPLCLKNSVIDCKFCQQRCGEGLSVDKTWLPSVSHT